MRPLDHPAGEDYPATDISIAAEGQRRRADEQPAMTERAGLIVNAHQSAAIDRAMQRDEQPATSSRWPECGAIGTIAVGDEVGGLRCDKPIGHLGLHRTILEWGEVPGEGGTVTPEPNPAICPECLTGKHGACNGVAWDFMSDQATPCRCACQTPTEADDEPDIAVPAACCGIEGCVYLKGHAPRYQHSWGDGRKL